MKRRYIDIKSRKLALRGVCHVTSCQIAQARVYQYNSWMKFNTRCYHFHSPTTTTHQSHPSKPGPRVDPLVASLNLFHARVARVVGAWEW